MKLIRHFRKYHNYLFAPLPPPPKKRKKMHNHCFQFLLGTENNGSAKIFAVGVAGGGDKKIIIIFPKVVNGNTFFVM